MKNKLLFLLTFFTFLFSFNSCHEITSNAVKLIVAIDSTSIMFPAPLGSISDFEKVLTNEQIRSLDSIIIQNERNSKFKINIVSTQSIKPFNSMHDFSSNLLENWKNEDDKNQSIMIVFSEKLNEIHIETGKNLQKKLPEKVRKRIIKNSIQPDFEDKDYYSGLEKGLKKIFSTIKTR